MQNRNNHFRAEQVIAIFILWENAHLLPPPLLPPPAKPTVACFLCLCLMPLSPPPTGGHVVRPLRGRHLPGTTTMAATWTTAATGNIEDRTPASSTKMTTAAVPELSRSSGRVGCQILWSMVSMAGPLWPQRWWQRPMLQDINKTLLGSI